MSKVGHLPGSDVPWSFPVAVAQLPDAGSHYILESSAAQRDLIAKAAGVNAVLRAEASFDVTPEIDGRVSVAGKVTARVEQTCVISLDPFENEVDETIAVDFAPPAQIPVSAKSIQKEQGEDTEIPDAPEPIVNGAIDLGQLALEFLILGIDPYPRKPGVAFAPPEVPEDPEEHPFAALKALKEAPNGLRDKKPKGK